MALGDGEVAVDKSFPELFTDHHAYVERVLRSLGVGQAELPDLRQEVFLLVHRRLSTFEGRSTLRTWIYGICLRVASSHRRKLRRRRELLCDTPPERSDEAEQLDAVQLRQTAELVERALSRLAPEQRAAFVLYELEQLPMEEVARRLGCPLKTGFTRLYAARKRVNAALRRALGAAALLEFATPAHPAAALSGSASAVAATPALGASLAVAAAAAVLLLPQLGAPATGATLAQQAEPAHREAADASYTVLPPSSFARAARPPDAQRVGESQRSARPRAQPEPPTASRFRVESQAIPSVRLLAHRIGPTEVVPVYAVAGQVPALPPALPPQTRTRLSPALLHGDHLRHAIDGRISTTP
jgi:RNA polymerase sigma-70 factor (ECF subfamily)